MSTTIPGLQSEHQTFVDKWMDESVELMPLNPVK